MKESLRPSEGVLIAVTTLGGYAVAFAHEVGYVGYFGVPWDLVTLDVTRVIVAVAAMLTLAWFLYIFMNPIASILADSSWPKPVTSRITHLIFPWIALAAYSYVGHVGPQVVIAFSLLTLVFGAIEFLLPLMTQRTISGYVPKLAAASSEGSSPLKSPLIGALIQLIGPATYNVLLLCTLAIFAAFGIGRGEAGKREWFHCPTDVSSVVLVRVYGATMIGARYDPATHLLSGELVVGTRGEAPWTNLTWSKVGNLTSPASGGK